MRVQSQSTALFSIICQKDTCKQCKACLQASISLCMFHEGDDMMIQQLPFNRLILTSFKTFPPVMRSSLMSPQEQAARRNHAKLRYAQFFCLLFFNIFRVFKFLCKILFFFYNVVNNSIKIVHNNPSGASEHQIWSWLQVKKDKIFK